MGTISRRGLMKSAGVAAGALMAGSGSIGRTARTARADDAPLTFDEKIIARSINSDPTRIPTLLGRLQNRQVAFMTAAFPNVPGLRLDACTYEQGDGFLQLDLVGFAVPDDDLLVMTHRVRNQPALLHVTTLKAEPGAIEAVGQLRVDKRFKAGDVRVPERLLAPNMCWGFNKSPAFVAGAQASPPYGETPALYPQWIERCFILTEQGRTFLDKTERVKTDEVPAGDPRNNPVWSQHYVGVWQRIQGEALPPNTSRTRYMFPLIGALSNDRKSVIALVSESPRYIAQAWHTCLHHVVNWLPSDAPALDRQWRMKLYATADEPIELMTRIASDFPGAMKLKQHAVAAQ